MGVGAGTRPDLWSRSWNAYAMRSYCVCVRLLHPLAFKATSVYGSRDSGCTMCFTLCFSLLVGWGYHSGEPLASRKSVLSCQCISRNAPLEGQAVAQSDGVGILEVVRRPANHGASGMRSCGGGLWGSASRWRYAALGPCHVVAHSASCAWASTCHRLCQRPEGPPGLQGAEPVGEVCEPEPPDLPGEFEKCGAYSSIINSLSCQA
jgi:hypothetical protein